MPHLRLPAIVLAAMAGISGLSARAEDARPQFISFETARPILQAMRATGEISLGLRKVVTRGGIHHQSRRRRFGNCPD